MHGVFHHHIAIVTVPKCICSALLICSIQCASQMEYFGTMLLVFPSVGTLISSLLLARC